MNILYIVKFHHDPLIAIGTSYKGTFEWLYSFINRYKVSLKDSYLISADQRQTIKRLESAILHAYGHHKPSKRQLKKYDSKDDFTQILKWDCQDAILDLIQTESKDEKLGIGMVTLDKLIY
jgi:hypothetical protein